MHHSAKPAVLLGYGAVVSQACRNTIEDYTARRTKRGRAKVFFLLFEAFRDAVSVRFAGSSHSFPFVQADGDGYFYCVCFFFSFCQFINPQKEVSKYSLFEVR